MKLLSCIAFHYKAERLTYLRQVLHMQQFLSPEVHVVVTTNTNDQQEIESIKKIAPENSGNFNLGIESFSQLPNPWLLPWAHKVVFAGKLKDSSYSHFMFSEDDIEVTSANVQYWLRAREWLRPFGLYPSFFRVEWSEQKSEWVSTDIAKPVSLALTFQLRSLKGDYHYLNMPNPYQAMFFYDRELMEEHAASDTFDIMKYARVETIDHNKDWGGGGVAERANYALTFVNVPAGFTSRNVVPYFEKYMMLDPHCFIHHLPNNYANSNSEKGFGQLPVRSVLCA
jgi:hypothetical protein